MPFPEPRNWNETLPTILKNDRLYSNSYLSVINTQLASITDATKFQEIINEEFLYLLYHACIELFKLNHPNKGIPGVDDLENTLITLLNSHFVNFQDIFSILQSEELYSYLENIEKNMSDACDNSESEENSKCAGEIKSMACLLSYYTHHRYALIELERRVGALSGTAHDIKIIESFIEHLDLDMDDAIVLYNDCIYSRIFIKNQGEFEKIFSNIFDDLIERENINKNLDLCSFSPQQLNDMQFIVSFKQATTGTSEHGYFSNLGMFLKHAYQLLKNEHKDLYYLDLFINNMMQNAYFGEESKIIKSLQTITSTTDIFKSLLEIPRFSSQMSPYIFNNYYSLNETNSLINKHPKLLCSCVHQFSFLDKMKLYYLYPSIELLSQIQRQSYQFGEIDPSRLKTEEYAPVLKYMEDSYTVSRKEKVLLLFMYALEGSCNINININILEKLIDECCPPNCPLFIGIHNILFSVKLYDALIAVKDDMPAEFQDIIQQITSSLNQKNLPVMERFHKIQNICEDHINALPKDSELSDTLRQIVKSINDLDPKQIATRSVWSLFFKKEVLNTDKMIEALHIGKKDLQTHILPNSDGV